MTVHSPFNNALILITSRRYSKDRLLSTFFSFFQKKKNHRKAIKTYLPSSSIGEEVFVAIMFLSAAATNHVKGTFSMLSTSLLSLNLLLRTTHSHQLALRVSSATILHLCHSVFMYATQQQLGTSSRTCSPKAKF